MFLNVSLNVRGKDTRTECHKQQLLKKEGEPKRNRTEVLTPYRWAKAAHEGIYIYIYVILARLCVQLEFRRCHARIGEHRLCLIDYIFQWEKKENFP